jgi:hypothetical protein
MAEDRNCNQLALAGRWWRNSLELVFCLRARRSAVSDAFPNPWHPVVLPARGNFRPMTGYSVVYTVLTLSRPSNRQSRTRKARAPSTWTFLISSLTQYTVHQRAASSPQFADSSVLESASFLPAPSPGYSCPQARHPSHSLNRKTMLGSTLQSSFTPPSGLR